MFNHWHHDSGRRSLQPDLYEAFCAGLDVQQAEIDRLRTELRHVTESCKVFREEAQRLQAPSEPPRQGFLRPYVFADGRHRYERLPLCVCDDRRGPAGGVCGNCAAAIPSTKEQA